MTHEEAAPTSGPDKYALTRGTRIFIGAGVLLVVAAITVIITMLTVQLSESSKQVAEDLAQIAELKLQYESLYTEYKESTGQNPSAPTPTQVDRMTGLQGVNGEACPTGTKYQEVNITTATDGAVTFFACKT